MTDKDKLEKIKALADKMYSRMAYLTSDTRPIRQAMDEYHQFIINEYHKEEPVSEDMMEAAKHYLYSNILYDDVYVGNPTDKDCIEMFKAGAKWQKEQDQSTIELAEDHAMLAGMEKMKEQMMAKAVDVTIAIPYQNGDGGYTQLVYSKEALPFGDKMKVLVIKED